MAERDAGAVAPTSPIKQRGGSGCLPCARSQQISSPSREKSSSRARRIASRKEDAREMAEVITDKEREEPRSWEHLLVMVNGIVGSADDWKFAAKKFKEKLGERVFIYRSSCNAAISTFDGVDVMGKRLAEEVQRTINETRGVQKISFVAHSLGGLVARYAIAQLYRPADLGLKDVDPKPEENAKGEEEKLPVRGTIAGLQAVNFITVATPHLGSRANGQLPILCGFRCLESAAVCIAHWFVGRTGRHLFLTDGKPNHPPLLCRMVTDCEDGMFLSALQLFKRHVAYANVQNDHMVGWRTSSLRRESELPKVTTTPIGPRYPHIVSVEEIIPDNEERNLRSPVAEVVIPPASDPLEEEMIRGLTKIKWERVDVNFHGTLQRFFAHSTIQVKSTGLHSRGADVIQHMIDNFVQ
ncbi:putative lipase YDL109C isoform X1 [Selaginella moellendorffii]|uniref:putative lipase YDL109C isoform X1 n=1 Tax=Selaginella moellendorffii TaxID=88036 RepID=UPI000D1C2B3C|nr:putative lipase YDL109C isoform X1 [Selaginella moellendorffii]|eukprot:XP_024516559.1 putative lipase YDL109C isoform X1 [Selaginella moellendorffii]